MRLTAAARRARIDAQRQNLQQAAAAAAAAAEEEEEERRVLSNELRLCTSQLKNVHPGIFVYSSIVYDHSVEYTGRKVEEPSVRVRLFGSRYSEPLAAGQGLCSAVKVRSHQPAHFSSCLLYTSDAADE